ncbi:H15 domain-containing protein [Mycena chlorophos]|uniref:Histone H1 n=1 Tax=Mycena chlorophos TaxID=658473 RepID=A0A8H6SIH2_MYCCL|nr:H15 domain-containing protein [Mycena chlorophos]
MVEASGTLSHTTIVHNAPPEDHGLKREYLAHLPVHQVIDICLRLDVHVPMALKRDIWPTDFRAALATMQNKPAKVEDAAASPPAVPTANGTDAKPPEQPPVAGPSTVPVAAPVQPYGYPPPAPYGAAPAAYYPGYPAYAYTYPPPYAYPGAQPFFTTPHAPDPAAAVDDGDLPSYEDMIVEGLTVVNDPEGLAPKDLFNWMASRYPVQSNFRPSASQALQKAYRRGRFEKSTSGKYRLNPNWEGGSSSTRRATRRPQTQAAVAPLTKPRMPSATPYSAPRVPFIPVPPRSAIPTTGAKIPSYSNPHLYAPPPSAVPIAKPNMPPNPSDAVYQSAQKILQTINFGAAAVDLSRIKAEPAVHSLTDHARADLQVQLVLLAAQLEEIAEQEQADDADGEDEDGDADAEMEEVVPVAS